MNLQNQGKGVFATKPHSDAARTVAELVRIEVTKSKVDNSARQSADAGAVAADVPSGKKGHGGLSEYLSTLGPDDEVDSSVFSLLSEARYASELQEAILSSLPAANKSVKCKTDLFSELKVGCEMEASESSSDCGEFDSGSDIDSDDLQAAGLKLSKVKGAVLKRLDFSSLPLASEAAPLPFPGAGVLPTFEKSGYTYVLFAHGPSLGYFCHSATQLNSHCGMTCKHGGPDNNHADDHGKACHFNRARGRNRKKGSGRTLGLHALWLASAGSVSREVHNSLDFKAECGSFANRDARRSWRSKLNGIAHYDGLFKAECAKLKPEDDSEPEVVA